MGKDSIKIDGQLKIRETAHMNASAKADLDIEDPSDEDVQTILGNAGIERKEQNDIEKDNGSGHADSGENS
jgi:hypothetical protein